MHEAKRGERETERRGLITRPRLERLLDESDARIALLAAPAGYGKTTLARQWLAKRRYSAVWYQARPASKDVAGLALGIRQAFAQSLDAVGDRVGERLRNISDPDGQALRLAGLLADDISQCPPGTRLVIDDYHHIAANPAAENFVATLVDATTMPLLITSRARPSWITAKHLLYGEVLELGRNVLAMTHEEADEVLDPGKSERRHSGLVALAEGWPAVIGLAALLPDPIDVSIQAVPEALHAYFAEELYQGMPETLQWHLAQLALAPSLAPGLASSLFGSPEILEEGYRRGFLTNDAGYDLHPLLRQFLRGKLDECPPADVRTTAEAIAFWYLSNGYWDEAFALASDFALDDVAVDLLESGIDLILSEGRLSTLDQWLELGRRLRPADPAVRLGEVESAFRRGRWLEAEVKALRLSDDLPEEHRSAARVLFRAGQIAQLDDRQNEALELLTRARELATTVPDMRRTLWSRFVTLCDLDEPSLAWEALVELEEIPPETVEDLVRARHGRLLWALRWGGIAQELASQEESLELLGQVPDPLVRTGFLQSIGSALGLATRYADAAKIAQRQLVEASGSGLEWVKPHALELKGLAQLGLRDFDGALSTLERAHSLAAAQDNLHSQVSSVALSARVYLARGEHKRALDVMAIDWKRSASPGMEGDYLATRALVLACCERQAEASQLADTSERVSNQIDARVLRAFVRATISHQQRAPDAGIHIAQAIDEANTTGNLDAFVAAYRAYPPLLTTLESLNESSAELVHRLVNRIDPRLATKAGFSNLPTRFGADREPLTPREKEVFDLLRQGMTNREIARSLWIEESTVKVHVRHILKKFAARSRTEAATIGVELLSLQQQQAEPTD
jgi:ATP/maltotriose-dependent transcriptional regulator MalT